MGWLSNLRRASKPAIEPVAAVSAPVDAKPTKMVIAADASLERKERAPGYISAAQMFQPYKPAPGVLPEGIAMDSAPPAGIPAAWAQQSYESMAAEGLTFMGYPYLAELAQRPEYRVITETIAKEMTRRWIVLKAASQDKSKQDNINEITKEFRRLKVRNLFRRAAEIDGFFGRAHLFIDYGDDPDSQELNTTIGDGWNAASIAKVAHKKIKKLRLIEPMWTFPAEFGATDPLQDAWYDPKAWYVMGRRIDASRLLTFIGREVPDLLKPVYAFGGLSLSQMAKPYVDNWLRTRQSVADLIRNFSTSVLKTNMADVLTGGPSTNIYNRAALFAKNRDNQGVMLLDKDSEDFVNVSAPLSGLDKLQAQAQEHMASVSQLPLVKLTGISPSGLNASGDTEIEVHGDEIHAKQEAMFLDPLQKLLGLVQLSLFGEVDTDIVAEFVPLEELSEKERAEQRKMEADTDVELIDAGVLMPEESRARIAADPSSPYPGLADKESTLSDEQFAEGLRQVFAPNGSEPDGGGALVSGLQEVFRHSAEPAPQPDDTKLAAGLKEAFGA